LTSAATESELWVPFSTLPSKPSRAASRTSRLSTGFVKPVDFGYELKAGYGSERVKLDDRV